MRCILLSVIFALAFMLSSPGQEIKVGGGLTFSSGVEYNSGETGNPGFTVKSWIGLNKRNTFHLVPSIGVFNRYRLATGYFILKNYMIHVDIDGQYAVFQEGTVKIITLAGANYTYLTSEFEPVIITGKETLTDARDSGFGGNLGAGLELRMAPKWDFIVTGKYLFSKFPQFIISVQGVYYFKSRRRGYRR